MKELTRPSVMMSPLTTPTAAPAATPARMASSNGRPAFIARAAARPPRLIVEPTDRSRLPETTTRVAPIAAIPTTATACRMLSRFCAEKNTGLPSPTSSPSTTITARTMSSEPQARDSAAKRLPRRPCCRTRSACSRSASALASSVIDDTCLSEVSRKDSLDSRTARQLPCYAPLMHNDDTGCQLDHFLDLARYEPDRHAAGRERTA